MVFDYFISFLPLIVAIFFTSVFNSPLQAVSFINLLLNVFLKHNEVS